MNSKIKILLSLIILINFNSVCASTISGENIKNIARDWLKFNGVEENITILPEIQYPECSSVQLTNISTNFSLIKAQCFSPNKWSVILRNKLNKPKIIKKNIKTTLKKSKKIVQPEIEIYVLNKQLEKNRTIHESDITKIKLKKNLRIEGLVTTKENLLGKKTKVRIKKNSPIYSRNLKKDWLIEKNSIITVENNNGPITIKVDGIALENGDFNDRIRVKNMRSNEIISGFVLNKKKITINPKQF